MVTFNKQKYISVGLVTYRNLQWAVSEWDSGLFVGQLSSQFHPHTPTEQ